MDQSYRKTKIKQELLEKKIKTILRRANDPTDYIYDKFTKCERSIDFYSECLMKKLELESNKEEVNMSRIKMVERVHSERQKCQKHCEFKKHETDQIANEIKLVETRLSDLDREAVEFLNSPHTEDQLIGMICGHSKTSINKAVNLLKEQTKEQKLDEIETRIAELKTKLYKQIFMNQSLIFLKKSECYKYMISEFYLNLINCSRIPIQKFVLNIKEEFNMNIVACNCLGCQKRERDKEFKEKFEDEDEYEEDDEEEDEYEEDEDENEEEEDEEMEEEIIEEEKDEEDKEHKEDDHFFGLLLHFDNYISNKKSFL